MKTITTIAMVLGLPFLATSQAGAATSCENTEALFNGVSYVKPLHEKFNVGKAELTRKAGARLFIKAEAGMSAPYLQRQIDCRTREALDQTSDPLTVPTVKATVSTSGEYFVVELRATGSAHAQEVHRRSDQLLASNSR